MVEMRDMAEYPELTDSKGIDFEINIGTIVFLVFCFFLGWESVRWSIIRRSDY